MNCRTYRRELDREIRGLLVPPELQAMSGHARSCADCARERRAWLRITGRIRAALLVTPRVNCVSRVMARVRQAVPVLVRAHRLTSRQFLLSFWTALAIAAALAVDTAVRAPGALRDLPLIRLVNWVPVFLGDLGKFTLESIDFLVLLLADLLRILITGGDGLEFLLPARMILTALLAAAVLSTTAVFIRRDLVKESGGTGLHDGGIF